MNFKSKYGISLFISMFFAQPACAWDASVEGPDVFDKTKVVAIQADLNEGLVVQCDSQDELLIAYIFRMKDFDASTETPAKLLIKAGDAQTNELDAVIRSWNENYAGVVASGKSTDATEVVKQIQVAKGKIQIGVDFLGKQKSAEVSSRGSTKAMDTVLSKCKLEGLGTN